MHPGNYILWIPKQGRSLGISISPLATVGLLDLPNCTVRSWQSIISWIPLNVSQGTPNCCFCSQLLTQHCQKIRTVFTKQKSPNCCFSLHSAHGETHTFRRSGRPVTRHAELPTHRWQDVLELPGNHRCIVVITVCDFSGTQRLIPTGVHKKLEFHRYFIH